VAELYDVIYTGRNQRDVDFFVEYARQAGGRTLELGCGTGRVLIPSAVAGSKITGLDISLYMLQKCREKLAKQPREVSDRVSLIRGNMADFQTEEEYSLVTLPFRPFHHLISTDEEKACLMAANQRLVSHGTLILDLVNCYPPSMYDPKYWAEQEIQRDLKLPDGRKLRFASRITDFHRDRQYNDMELIYYVSYPDGRVDRLVQAFPFRYFFRYEIEYLLELCRFRVIDLFGDYDKSAYFNDSPEMVFVAEKK
jgi:SAM-dependent methyltransferase